jgi:hypothetical protein
LPRKNLLANPPVEQNQLQVNRNGSTNLGRLNALLDRSKKLGVHLPVGGLLIAIFSHWPSSELVSLSFDIPALRRSALSTENPSTTKSQLDLVSPQYFP